MPHRDDKEKCKTITLRGDKTLSHALITAIHYEDNANERMQPAGMEPIEVEKEPSGTSLGVEPTPVHKPSMPFPKRLQKKAEDDH